MTKIKKFKMKMKMTLFTKSRAPNTVVQVKAQTNRRSLRASAYRSKQSQH